MSTRPVRIAAFLISFLILILFIRWANGIIIPLYLGFLFAVLAYPIVRFLTIKWRFPNALASASAVSLLLGIGGLLVWLMSAQIASFFKDIPEVTQNLEQHIENIQYWIKRSFHLSLDQQEHIVHQTINESKGVITRSMQQLLPYTSSLITFVLVPLYTFFILFYRKNLYVFLRRLFSENIKIRYILDDVNAVIRQYLIGLLLQMSFVALSVGLGLYFLGLKYFVFLALLSAVLNLIPYIGIWTSALISVAMMLAGSPDLFDVLWVLILFVAVQLVDGNVIVPFVIGSKVQINALASLLGILVGSMLAGIGGMFLAMPSLAILKVVCDNVPRYAAFSALISVSPEED